MRALICCLLGILGVGFVLAAAADAHVTVDAPGATPGGSDQVITFRVPVEKDVNTVGLTVLLPAQTPIASVDVLPIAGWRHTERTSTLAKAIETDDGDITSAVTQITWTAENGGLLPGEFGEFTIIAGQLPEASSLTFKALQTYRDGSVVRWIETAAPGSSSEPEFPAPTLALSGSTTAGSSGGQPSGGTQTSSQTSSATQTATAAQTSTQAGSTTGPVVLSIIAIVVAAAALGLAVVSRARARGTP